jgi:hypothetical protein
MELVGLRNNKGNRTQMFGTHTLGTRCEQIHISPQELLHYITQCKLLMENDSVVLKRLARYLHTLTLCFPPNHNARNKQPQE